MRHILLVTICYPPELRSISVMMRELAEDLVQRGNRVTVLTSWPQYNLVNAHAQQQVSRGCYENGVRVLRIKTLRTHKTGYYLRGIAQLLLPIVFIRALRRLIKEHVDTVIVYSPHLPLVKVGEYVKSRDGARFILNIQDIFPQNAIDLGVLKNRFLIWFFQRMELQAYRSADAITTHTIGGRLFLLDKKHVPEAKLSVIANWIDPEPFATAQSTGKFRKQWGIDEKACVLLFPGVLGPSQHLEFLLAVAEGVRDLQNTLFLIVGDGTEKQRLASWVKERQLSNVQFEPYVSAEEYPLLLKEVDVGLLCLGPQTKTPAVPGKLLGFMAASLPVVGFLNRESDAYRIIEEARCGAVCVSDDLETAIRNVRTMVNAPRAREDYGKNGYAYVRQRFSKKICIDAIERLL